MDEKAYQKSLQQTRAHLKSHFPELKDDDFQLIDKQDAFTRKIMERSGRTEKEIVRVLENMDYLSKSRYSKKP